ncbi:MAG: hypothetical protein HYW57_08835 [Ignavibacteriales bacterium]|nr:hypothetical protein [Ignavibacteriales bacterium]
MDECFILQKERTMKRLNRWIAILFALVAGVPGTTWAQEILPWSIDGGITFSHFQQQVKAEVGDPRGERLVNETQFGFMAMGTYKVWQHVSVGVFLQFDRGNRHAARFDGFDSETGRTVTKDKIGGNYDEFWAGPMLRVEAQRIFGEFGYGLVGFRNDDARTDLVSSSGDSTGTLTLLPSVAWYAGIGGAIKILRELDLVIRVEYRLRYYDKREGNPFASDIEHGTQNITPYVGVRWKF